MIEALPGGPHQLHQALLKAPLCSPARDSVIIPCDDPDPPVLLIRSGVAHRSHTLADGRRSILDLFLPGDIAGLDHAAGGHASREIVAAGRVAYHALSAESFRALMANSDMALGALALMAEACSRMDRLAEMIGRLDAQERIAALLLSLYERLRRRGLVDRASFSLPLTQEQMGDHLGLTLVHVNRILRRMREQRLVAIDRQRVVIIDFGGLRALAQGLPRPPRTLPQPVLAELPQPATIAAAIAAEPVSADGS